MLSMSICRLERKQRFKNDPPLKKISNSAKLMSEHSGVGGGEGGWEPTNRTEHGFFSPMDSQKIFIFFIFFLM